MPFHLFILLFGMFRDCIGIEILVGSSVPSISASALGSQLLPKLHLPKNHFHVTRWPAARRLPFLPIFIRL